MRKIHECAEDIKNILNDAERTEEVDGDMLCSINELVDEILSIYCLEKQQRKMAIAEENEILAEEDKKQQESYIALITLTKEILETCIDLLGIQCPDRM